MRKSLLFIWFICLVVLGVGTIYYPNNAAFWLASGSTHIMVLRGLLATLLAIQIVTQPPRSVLFRIFAGTTAGVVGLWSLQALFGFNLELLDALAFLGSSMAIGVTALERDTEQELINSEPMPARS